MATRFTGLVGCIVPIQLAGMGPVCSDALCAAVSEAGGLGMITVAATTPEALEARLDHIRSLTSKPIGANFLIPVTDRDCRRVASHTVRVIDFFWGAPDPQLVELAHGGGALVSWQVGSMAEGVAAERAGCDFIIAQGLEAGGHIRGTLGLLPLLSQVLDEVAIPVLAAGGVGGARALAAVLATGADGVRCGTRFVAAEESAAHPVYVEALIRARAEDAVRTSVYHVRCPLCPSTHGALRSAIEAAQSLTGDVGGGVGRRLARPALSARPDDDRPSRLVEQTVARDDPAPQAVACYGLLARCWAGGPAAARTSGGAGRPISARTRSPAIPCAGARRAQERGQRAVLRVGDNASGHARPSGRAGVRPHPRQGTPAGHGVRLLVCSLPPKSPWLHPLAPQWVAGQQRGAEPARLLSAPELQDRVCAALGCDREPHLIQPHPTAPTSKKAACFSTSCAGEMRA